MGNARNLRIDALVGHRVTRDVPRIAPVWETILDTLGIHGRRGPAAPTTAKGPRVRSA